MVTQNPREDIECITLLERIMLLICKMTLETLYRQEVKAISINEGNIRISFNASKKQLGEFKRIKLENSIVVDSCMRTITRGSWWIGSKK